MRRLRFKTIELPTGRTAVIPTDIHLRFPDANKLTPRQRQATAFIPWDDTYLDLIPPAYKEFFAFALPYMHSRTTNIHTALSISQLPTLLANTHEPVDERAIYLAVILHDIGWSKVSLQGIADSLSYSGLTLSEASQIPKEQHILIGAALAREILEQYDFGKKPLSELQMQHVTTIIRRHDHDAPWEIGKHKDLSLETLLMCDADRLWSYSHENFWQDTVRKNTEPEVYLKLVGNAIERYFFTHQGTARAYALLAERQSEVESYKLKSSSVFK